MNPSGARQALAIGVVLVWSAWTASARADVFVLSSGGRVEGQLRIRTRRREPPTKSARPGAWKSPWLERKSNA